MKKKFDLNSISPQKLSEYLYKNVTIKDIAYLSKRKNLFKKVRCPACNSKKKNFFLKKKNFSYQICTVCKTFYMSPRPTEKILGSFYKQSKVYKYFHEHIFPAGEKSRYLNINVPRVNKIKNILKKKKKKNASIIDIGSGYGTFCRAAANDNFFSKVYALDPAATKIKNYKNRIIPINATFEEFFKKNDNSYDVVTFFEVIEHLFDPDEFLKKIKRILKKNGLIVFTCPNGEGFDVQLLRKHSNTIDHEHLNYFNLKSIKTLLKRNKYKIIDISTPGQLDVDIVKEKISEKNIKIKLDYFYEKILNDSELSKNFQNFLSDNSLSSNMWVVATI